MFELEQHLIEGSHVRPLAKKRPIEADQIKYDLSKGSFRKANNKNIVMSERHSAADGILTCLTQSTWFTDKSTGASYGRSSTTWCLTQAGIPALVQQWCCIRELDQSSIDRCENKSSCVGLCSTGTLNRDPKWAQQLFA